MLVAVALANGCGGSESTSADASDLASETSDSFVDSPAADAHSDEANDGDSPAADAHSDTYSDEATVGDSYVGCPGDALINNSICCTYPGDIPEGGPPPGCWTKGDGLLYCGCASSTDCIDPARPKCGQIFMCDGTDEEHGVAVCVP